MSAIAIMEEPSILAAPNFLQRAFKRLSDELSADAEDWSAAVQGLRRFQDEKLLDDPTPENLQAHQRALEMLIAFEVLFARLPKLRLAGTPQYKDVYHFHGLEELRVQF